LANEIKRRQEMATETSDRYTELARESLETFLKEGRLMDVPEGLPEDMSKKAGIFVSLKKNGQLRGCIGTIEPTGRPVADEVIRFAVISATEDPRFPPVREEELPELAYSVDVLGEPEAVSGMDELDAKVYGVIVSKGYRRGVLLPDLETVDTPGEQVDIALRKAGILPQEDYTIERFRVERHR
jgi:AmmeMemoRadiSam system protein A